MVKGKDPAIVSGDAESFDLVTDGQRGLDHGLIWANNLLLLFKLLVCSVNDVSVTLDFFVIGDDALGENGSKEGKLKQ